VTANRIYEADFESWRISGGDAPQLEDVIGNWPA
jgi:hypothetical protein